jgi:hypothetical protein
MMTLTSPIPEILSNKVNVPDINLIKGAIKDLFEVFDLIEFFDPQHPDLDERVKSAYSLFNNPQIGKQARDLIIAKCGDSRIDSSLSDGDYQEIFNNNSVRALINSVEYQSLLALIRG